MSPNDNVYKFDGYSEDGEESYIMIEPNRYEGYKSESGEDIILITATDTICDIGNSSFVAINLQTAKLMIEALQEIIDYVEDNI